MVPSRAECERRDRSPASRSSLPPRARRTARSPGRGRGGPTPPRDGSADVPRDAARPVVAGALLGPTRGGLSGRGVAGEPRDALAAADETVDLKDLAAVLAIRPRRRPDEEAEQDDREERRRQAPAGRRSLSVSQPPREQNGADRHRPTHAEDEKGPYPITVGFAAQRCRGV